MCGSTTKQRIGAALRQLMSERPFEKITVQNLMDATNMKRQSFYYHFRDTRDVLLWICRQELVEPLRRSTLDSVEWAVYALQIAERDRAFYRKAVNAVHPDIILDIGTQILSLRIAKLLYGSVPAEDLDANQRSVVDFMVQSVMGQFVRFCAGRVPLNEETARLRIAALVNVLQKSDGI